MSETVVMHDLEDLVCFAGQADTVDDRRKLNSLLQDTATFVEVQSALGESVWQAA